MRMWPCSRRPIVDRVTVGSTTADWVARCALPAALATLAVYETLTASAGSNRPGPALVVGLAMAGALAWRRQAPLFVTVVVSLLFTTYPLLDSTPVESLAQAVAVLVAALTVGAQASLRPALVAAAVVVGAGTLRSWQMGIYDAGSVIVNSMWGLAAWGVGRLLHERERRVRIAHQALSETERLREVGEREAVSAERRRIARELHDVVAHAVTVIVVQARGARRALDGHPEEVRRALDAIEEMGRDAIDELRRMLALLDDPDEQEVRSGPAELRALVERVNQAGLPVTLSITGAPRHRAASVDVSAYRVVQEALTNAMRHGGGPVAVDVTYAADRIDVKVDAAIGTKSFTGTGRGLAGLRERVRLTGGSLQVGNEDDGRYRVHAALPLASPS